MSMLLDYKTDAPIIFPSEIKKDLNKRFYYHISTSYFGDKVILYPRTWGCHRPTSEPNIKRICVAPSVPHCLSSVPLSKSKIYVYRTYRKIQAYYPRYVADSKTTKEKWLLDPTCFILENIIPKYLSMVVCDFTKGSPDGEASQQKHYLETFKKLLTKDGRLNIYAESWK